VLPNICVILRHFAPTGASLDLPHRRRFDALTYGTPALRRERGSSLAKSVRRPETVWVRGTTRWAEGAEILLRKEKYDLVIVSASLNEWERGRILSAAGRTPTYVLRGLTFVSELLDQAERLLPPHVRS
jgi:hypothetical protein